MSPLEQGEMISASRDAWEVRPQVRVIRGCSRSLVVALSLRDRKREGTSGVIARLRRFDRARSPVDRATCRGATGLPSQKPLPPQCFSGGPPMNDCTRHQDGRHRCGAHRLGAVHLRRPSLQSRVRGVFGTHHRGNSDSPAGAFRRLHAPYGDATLGSRKCTAPYLKGSPAFRKAGLRVIDLLY